ncbi:adenylyl-sulfate kinase [candidate division KSB1 bacterium]|nr:adenylyl-sulfate kinase [candidate division KSB1 bacterium]
MAEQKATHITWHDAEITRDAREKMLKQKGVVLWFTGLSGSGKSTVATAVEKVLYEKGHLTVVLDGDNIRHGLNKNLGFSPEDREENIRRIGEVAKLFTDAGVIAMTAFISPYIKDRDQARSLVDDGRFVEVYCKCSLKACEERDPKGLYKKARAGEIKQFTGIDAPYEAPDNPEVVVETDQQSLEESAQTVLDYLIKQGII